MCDLLLAFGWGKLYEKIGNMIMSKLNDSRLVGRTIFVVEDDALLAMTVEDILEDAGAGIVGPFMSCGDAMDEIARLEPTTISAAILDVNVKGESSYAVADALAARAIPVIFSTGYGVADWQDHNSGAAPLVISKPFQPSELVAALQSIVAP